MNAHQMQGNWRERSERASDAGELEGIKIMHIRCRGTGGNEVNAHKMLGKWRERSECTSDNGELEGTKRMHIKCGELEGKGEYMYTSDAGELEKSK